MSYLFNTIIFPCGDSGFSILCIEQFIQLIAYTEFSKIFSSISGIPSLLHKVFHAFNGPHFLNYCNFVLGFVSQVNLTLLPSCSEVS